MKIAIDCRSVSGSGKAELAGVAHYTARLVRHLLSLDEDNRYILLFDDHAHKDRIHEMIGSNHSVQTKILPLSGWKRMLPYAYSHHAAAKSIMSSGVDVTHFPSGHLPTGFRGKSVLTVHDMATHTHPEWFPTKGFFARRIVASAGPSRATRIIATSNATKTDLQRSFAIMPGKIDVIYEGVDQAPAKDSVDAQLAIKRLGLAEPYLLCMGTIEPRKNVMAVVEAFGVLCEKFPKLVGDTHLVVAGAIGWQGEIVRARVVELNSGFRKRGPHIDMPGYLSEQDKFHLLSRALAFVAPSLGDHCGRAVLEAMASGVPIIASDRGVLPELAARTGVIVDPTHRAELVLAMKHMLEDSAKRAEWGRKALLRSLEFSWDRAAGETLATYKKAAKL